MQQKRCPLSRALSGFCNGGGARQTIPHRSGAPRHEVFPAMVRVLWHRIGQIRRRGTAAAGYAQWLARTPGEEERDNDALRPNDPKERGPDNDVERVEEDLENLHDKARPL